MSRCVRILAVLFLLIGWIAPPGQAQPFDLVVPYDHLQEDLTTELRSLHAIERDLAIEKLNDPRTKLRGLIELGDLRRDQGRLEEARRFYEMALQIQPENRRANTGLAMVYYDEGQFGRAKTVFDQLTRMYPLSDRLKEDVERVRAQLRKRGQVGLAIP